MRLYALPTIALFAVGTSLAACGSSTENGPGTFPDASTSTTDGGGDGGSVVIGDGGTTVTDAGIQQECATGKTGTRRLPGYIQLVLDGSGSMKGARYTALQNAVNSVVSKWVADNDPSFGVGVSIFADSKDPTSSKGPYPSSADVGIAPVTAAQQAAIATRVSGAGAGSTPSFLALSGNYPYLKAFDPTTKGLPAGGKKILVFMSDGEPSDCGGGANAKCTVLPTQFAAEGITTYAILFSDGGTTAALRNFMAQIAKNGGGTANANCDPASTTPATYCHYEVNTSSGNSAAIATAFAAAIEQARNSIDPCTLAIEQQPGQPFDPGLVNVTVTDGAGAKTDVVKDPANGWSYDDPANPTQVILHGTACAAVKADPKASVELVLGCPSNEGGQK